ncbi:hypothetical protein [Brachyspira hampsonii]|uniref:hypothetical protein n=1 Tax=Brachyspira hampsonii TaxID=1287055 RepID=UPI000D37767C|nr:hypothetical protein [Brachyspira hampsonii]PTY40870.1 hypothetical protein DQ06_10050 [Brachyspira hampsonii bv. II]
MFSLFKILDFLEKNIFQVATTLKNNKEEKQKEICKLKNIDWTKDNILPNFPKSLLKEYGFQDKPILLKFNVIDRNFNDRHKDIDKEKAIRILGNALYKTDEIFYGRVDRPNYYNLITRIDEKHNDLVTVELSNEKDNYEIVHFFVIRNTTRKKYERYNNELKNKS